MSQPPAPAAEFNNGSDMLNDASSVFEYYYRPNRSYGSVIIAVMSAVGKLFPLVFGRETIRSCKKTLQSALFFFLSFLLPFS